MNVFSTIGKDKKEYFFEYKYASKQFDGRNKIEFQVNFLNESEKGNWFDFKITPIDDNTFKVTDMFYGKEEHRGKSLPDSLIILAGKLFKKVIVSSSNNDQFKTERSEWRSESATKVWDRLVEKNLASYDAVSDTYATTQLHITTP